MTSHRTPKTYSDIVIISLYAMSSRSETKTIRYLLVRWVVETFLWTDQPYQPNRT